MVTEEDWLANISCLMKVSLYRLTCWSCLTLDISVSSGQTVRQSCLLSNTHSCAHNHNTHTHHCHGTFIWAFFKKKKKKKRIYWTVTAFSNNPPWERAVRNSRHTIESKSFSGKMQYNHGAFLSALHFQKRRRYASFSKGPSQLFTQDCRGYKSTA